jgi:hypothetical protein
MNFVTGPAIVFELPIAAVAGVCALYVFLKRATRKRTDALQAEALQLGFKFDGDDWWDSSHAPQFGTALFERGNGPGFTNIMTGTREGLKVSIFDYSFLENAGRYAPTYRQTVAAFSKPEVYFIDFELRPSETVDKIKNALLHKNINFETDPEFSRRFTLLSSLKDEIRSLFTPSLRAFLESLDPAEKWHVEASGDFFVVYQFKKRTPPENLQAFLDQTTSIATKFFESMTPTTIK